MSKNNKPKFVPITFVPTSLRKPPKDGEYVCVIEHVSGNHYITTLNFVKEFGLFNVHVDPYTREVDASTAIDVAYWASANFIRDTLNLVMNKEDDTDGKW